MSLTDYSKARRLGKKDYQARLQKKLRPTLAVLDEILPQDRLLSEVPLGLVHIPVNQIVGTKSASRSSAFSANFMPILQEDTEFAGKWSRLSASQVDEGIRDPIKAYEYMNLFYVEEGHKRVSVLKYFGADSIPAMVTRILPERTEEKENKIYYEFLDFYRLSEINEIWFSQEGRFAKLQQAVGKAPQEPWTEEEKLIFRSIYSRFLSEFLLLGGQKLSITPGDAFLGFLTLHDYRQLSAATVRELEKMVDESWDEELEMEGLPAGADKTHRLYTKLRHLMKRFR